MSALVIGFGSGYTVHKIYIYLRGEHLNRLSFWIKFGCAVLVQVIILALLVLVRFLTPWLSEVFVYTCMSNTLLVFGMSLGVEFGPTINGVFRLGRPFLWPIRVVVGIVIAYICGYKPPITFTINSFLAVVSGLFILSIEMYRSKTAETGHQVPIRFVTKHVIDQRELKRTSLPVKLSLWDFAGDDFFYNTHQVFIASRAIFLVVFSLAECADIESIESVVQRLLFWLHSICTHTLNSNSLIFIVGTHRDSVDNTIRQNVARYLKKTLYDTNSMYCNRLVINSDNTPLWVVENSMSTDNDVKELQTAIRGRCLAIDDDENTYPVRWLKFKSLLKREIAVNTTVGVPGLYATLSRIVSTLWNPESVDDVYDKGILPFKDVFDYSQKHCGVETREEVVRMLQFFHDTGHLIYISNDPILRQFVLMNPRLLIDAFKLIVNIPQEKDRKPSLASKWNRLSKDGIIHHKLLQNLLESITEHTRVLLTLLQCYDFLCPLGRIASPPHGFMVDEYIIPSMRPIYKDDSDRLGPVQPFKRLYFDFGFFRPDSIFSRLVSRCIQISQYFKVYRNVGRFTLEGYSFRVDLTEHSPEQHFIVVTVALVQGSNPYELVSRLNAYIQAIRSREFPDLIYRCGVLCQFPPPHEDVTSEDALHVLPLCNHGDDFPAMGSTVTKLCQGAPQSIELTSTNWKEGTLHDEPGLGMLSHDCCQRIADNPALYDIYISCSQRDDVWVKDTLLRILQNTEWPLYVKVNSYTNREENSAYIKNCPVKILLVNRFSAKDGRCEEDRELAYLYHESSSVIHILNDKHEMVTKIKKALLPSHVCLDYIKYKTTGEEQVFYEELLELISNVLRG
ncbi:uncharacterized protein LOC144438639 isoform X2 [Glandiceps talaboti]